MFLPGSLGEHTEHPVAFRVPNTFTQVDEIQPFSQRHVCRVVNTMVTLCYH